MTCLYDVVGTHVIIKYSFHDTIPLPNPPTGPTLLPPVPQDPPTLVDVSNAVAYNKQIGVSYGTHVFFH